MTELYAVGHITNDLEPTPHMGGAVAYVAVAFKRLGGGIAHVLTEIPPGHPYLNELSELGVDAERLPTVDPDKESNITTFRNFDDRSDHRNQIVADIQDKIDLQDVANFPQIPNGSVVFVAPVIGEVDPELFPDFANKRHLVVAPQGYFRQATEQGAVERKPWNKLDSLASAELVVLSDEDLTFDSSVDQTTLDRIRALCPAVVLTQGAEGLTVFQRGEQPLHIQSMPIADNEIISLTGAGDSCAAALTWHYLKWGKMREAATFGALYSALKIMGTGGADRGVQALPTLDQVKQFIIDNPERINYFLSSNGLKSLPL